MAFDGLYKVVYSVGEAPGRSVMYVEGGRMLGGNSAFAHIGTYEEIGDEIVSELVTQRHNHDPDYKPLLQTDVATLRTRGRAYGDIYRFQGGSDQLPGIPFRSEMTPITDEGCAPAGTVGEGGLINGLYSCHIRMLDGIDGGNTGVMLLHDGRLLGGDAFFYYLGAYSSARGRWKGEFVNQEHTPAKSARPLFGGHEVGIGFSGTCNDAGAEAEATALVGKRSIRFKAVLKLLRRA